MTATAPLEKHVTVNGVRLRYLDWGTEGKMPLICLHGHTAELHMWDEFAEVASSRYHVLAVDQRGHGDSQWADTGYDRDRFVEDLAEFADALVLPRFVLVGLSMGGWNSLLYALDHPERVEKIVIVDIAPQLSTAFIEMDDKQPLTPMDFFSLDAAMEWTRQMDPWASEARLRRETEDKMRQRDDGRWTWKADPSLFNLTLTDPGLIGRYWKALETVPCPILEVRGVESVLVTDEVIQRMEKVGKQFRSVDVAGAGHIVTVDKPKEFIQATAEFLGISA